MSSVLPSLDRGFRMHRISTRQDAHCAGGFEFLLRGPQRRLRFQASNGLARVWSSVFEFNECGHLDAEPARVTRAFNKEADAIAEALSNAMPNIGS
jgi:hypothetical protein